MTRFTILWLFLSIPSSIGLAGAQEPSTPAEVFQRILSYQHGFHRLPDSEMARLERIKAAPQPYIDLLRNRFPNPPVLARSEAEAHPFYVACGLLGQIKTPDAADLLASWYVKLTDAMADPKRRRDLNSLILMQSNTLLALGGIHRDIVVNRIFRDLETMNGGVQNTSLSYLASVFAQDPTVLSRLRAIHTNPRSKLFKERGLGLTIEYLAKRPLDGQRAP